MAVVTRCNEKIKKRCLSLEKKVASLEQKYKSLQKTEKMYRAVFENNTNAVFIFDLDLTISHANATAIEMTGYTAKSLIGKKRLLDFVCREDKERIKLLHSVEMDQTSEHSFDYNFRFVTKQGEIKELSAQITSIPGSSFSSGVFLDVTNQNKLAAERIRLASAVEQSSETFIITDSSGTVQYVNNIFESMIGITKKEAIGRKVSEIFIGQNDEEIFRKMSFSVENGEIWSGRVQNQRPDGSLIQTETTVTPIYNPTGKLVNFLCIKRDITSETQLELQLRQAQKIQAIGTLAGGIAHDFNNILAGIIGYAEMALSEAPKKSDIPRKINLVLNGCHRAKDLVKQILTFSRQSEAELRPVQIDLIVKEVIKLIKSTLPSTIKVRREISCTRSIVMADPTQIHQVLMNLCTNAFHAMKKAGGDLVISISDITHQDIPAPTCHHIQPGAYLLLMVSDTGCGMDETTVERIFEPYFTTKKPGEGTGLGMAVIHGIIDSIGGFIEVSSQIKIGTEIKIYLPKCEDNCQLKANTISPLPCGDETILLVDDDQYVLKMNSERLESLGYTVTAIHRSSEALEVFKKNSREIDLIITDLTLPELTGFDLIERFRYTRNDVPIILCTGFDAGVDFARLDKLGVNGFMTKPVSFSKLANRIRHLLDGNACTLDIEKLN